MNPIDASRYFLDDALPPEGKFTSWKKLVTAINAWAAPPGYAFSVNSWKTSSGRIELSTYVTVAQSPLVPHRNGCKRLQYVIQDAPYLS